MGFLHGEIDAPRVEDEGEAARLRQELSKAFISVLNKERELWPMKYEEFWSLHGPSLLKGAMCVYLEFVSTDGEP